jgi:hypothetical protein
MKHAAKAGFTMGKRKLEKVKAWAQRATSNQGTITGSSESTRSQMEDPAKQIERERWLEPDEFGGEFILTAKWPGADNPPALNFFDHLNLIDVKSLAEVKLISSSIHFPPEPYFDTGRGEKPYPWYYLGLGSGSAVFELNNGDRRALSAVFTLDRSGHGNGAEHINVRVVSWPANKFMPDNTIDIPMHKLPATSDITLYVASGSAIQKSVTIHPKS